MEQHAANPNCVIYCRTLYNTPCSCSIWMSWKRRKIDVEDWVEHELTLTERRQQRVMFYDRSLLSVNLLALTLGRRTHDPIYMQIR